MYYRASGAFAAAVTSGIIFLHQLFVVFKKKWDGNPTSSSLLQVFAHEKGQIDQEVNLRT
jgi:hypothetical protein